jgi:hypothetical protein
MKTLKNLNFNQIKSKFYLLINNYELSKHFVQINAFWIIQTKFGDSIAMYSLKFSDNCY